MVPYLALLWGGFAGMQLVNEGFLRRSRLTMVQVPSTWASARLPVTTPGSARTRVWYSIISCPYGLSGLFV
ncbi:hypothetical protein EV126DRAFT_161246 [Verticillium dahliae]|nr:hypothetical protein EV126DRAFT_161246 [Verticillium dahliae]